MTTEHRLGTDLKIIEGQNVNSVHVDNDRAFALFDLATNARNQHKNFAIEVEGKRGRKFFRSHLFVDPKGLLVELTSKINPNKSGPIGDLKIAFYLAPNVEESFVGKIFEIDIPTKMNEIDDKFLERYQYSVEQIRIVQDVLDRAEGLDQHLFEAAVRYSLQIQEREESNRRVSRRASVTSYSE